jgi:hypothetical protein
MQPSAFDPGDTSWNSISRPLGVGEREHRLVADKSPTPGELFMETGIVLAVALGASVVIEFLLSSG